MARVGSPGSRPGRSTRATAAALAVAVGLALAGSSGADVVGEPPVVDCATRSQVLPGGDPPTRHELARDSVVAGPVIFAGLKAAAREPRRDFRPREPRRYVLWKSAMIVEAGRAVAISVRGAAVGHVELEVARTEAPPDARAATVRLVPCDPAAEVGGRPVGPRTPFPGGLLLDGPRCVRLAVTVEGRSDPIRRRVAFGRRTCSR